MSVERLVSTLPMAQHVFNWVQVRYYTELLRVIEVRAAEYGLEFMRVEKFNSMENKQAVGLGMWKLKDKVLFEISEAISAEIVVNLYPKLNNESAIDLIMEDNETGYTSRLVNDMISAIADGGYFLVDTTEGNQNLEIKGYFSLL